MSKYVIFITGLVIGVFITILTIKKGRDAMNKTEYVINVEQDKETGIWIATSSGDTGLVLESESLDELKRQVSLAIPKLLSVNQVRTEGEIFLDFRIREEIRKYAVAYA
jgi:ligand-binding sensor domain-containing protein